MGAWPGGRGLPAWEESRPSRFQPQEENEHPKRRAEPRLPANAGSSLPGYQRPQNTHPGSPIPQPLDDARGGRHLAPRRARSRTSATSLSARGAGAAGKGRLRSRERGRGFVRVYKPRPAHVTPLQSRRRRRSCAAIMDTSRVQPIKLARVRRLPASCGGGRGDLESVLVIITIIVVILCRSPRCWAAPARRDSARR